LEKCGCDLGEVGTVVRGIRICVNSAYVGHPQSIKVLKNLWP